MKPSKIYLDDPTLMFTNSGMNQLKGIILGKEEIKPDFDQLMNYQICLRAGGKHCDLSDVGRDSYHLTCFEMLGNWSLDRYGKKEAIRLAFNYLTQELRLNPERMYVTYFEGTDQIPQDTETQNIWKEWVPEDRILPGSYADNFWTMEKEGPCGVSTEIHYDLEGNRDASKLVNQNDPTVIELWNLVFIQYNKVGDDYNKLDRMYIDTGMGLERLAMILQKRNSLYTTKCFNYLIGYAQALSNCRPYGDDFSDQNLIDMAYRIFVDHIRTTILALYQGVEFGDHGKEHVLRKIFRRGMAHFFVMLNSGLVTPIMDRKIIPCMIDDILDYFLEKTHDTKPIQDALIKEEMMAINNWRNTKVLYKKYMKKWNDNRKVTEYLKNTKGIDLIFLEHMDFIKIKV